MLAEKSRDEHLLTVPWNNRKKCIQHVSFSRGFLLFYSSLGLPPENNTQRSKWKLRGWRRRATYYRIKYTVVVDSPSRFVARKRSPPPPPRPFRATKHGPIVQSPFGGRFRTWFVIEFQPLSEDEVQKAEWKPRARLHARLWSLCELPMWINERPFNRIEGIDPPHPSCPIIPSCNRPS